MSDEDPAQELHGDLLSGPVDIEAPAWATPEQVRQFQQYVDAANRWLARQPAGTDAR